MVRVALTGMCRSVRARVYHQRAPRHCRGQTVPAMTRLSARCRHCEPPFPVRSTQWHNRDLRSARARDCATVFAVRSVADGVGGLKVVQLTSPKSQPRYYGFSPDPAPELIATFETEKPALSLSRALERDRAVDETGGQVAVFSRLGSGPLTEEDMRKLYLDKSGKPWFVKDELDTKQAEQK